jgi:hypothetical protein
MTVTSPVTATGIFEQDFNNIIKYVPEYEHNDEPVFFSTPYFRSYFAEKDVSDIVGFYESVNFIKNYYILNAVWDDIDINHYQTYHRIMELFSFTEMNTAAAKEWLASQMTCKTFFHMMRQGYRRLGYTQTDQYFRDTSNQLDKLYKKNAEITRPKRWRLDVLHDHISYLYLESTVENKPHNNEFIPFPVSLDDGWKVYQPKDTLELALWGKKVHNCVLSYEDAIEQQRSAIILIEKDDSPKFTVEVDYKHLKNNKNISIKQVVGMSNSSLSQDDRMQCDNILNRVLIQK